MRRFFITIFFFLLVLSGLLSLEGNLSAFPVNQCAADRFASDLNCAASDVYFSNITTTGVAPSSCVGGQPVTLDLSVTVNTGGPARYDIGIFIGNDGKDGQVLSSGGGGAVCSVYTLPYTPAPFGNLDGDVCGDIKAPPTSAVMTLGSVPLLCTADTNGSAAGGNTGTSTKLAIPVVLTWDNQASPSGGTCNSNADPVPNTQSKCKSSVPFQTINVVVLPEISKTDGITSIVAGGSMTYTVVITNTTGASLPSTGQTLVFQDPAVANLNVSSVTCASSGGAVCPSVSVSGMQGSGLTISSMPVNSTMTFTIMATVSPTAPTGFITNTANVIAEGQTNSASDTDTVTISPSITLVKLSTAFSDPMNGTLMPKRIPGALVTYNIIATNSGQGAVDTNTVFLIDAIPTNTDIVVTDFGAAGSGPIAFTDGPVASGLSYAFTSLFSTTDDVTFFSDANCTVVRVPVAGVNGVDSLVRCIRVNPKGPFNADDAVPPSPSFTISFRVRIN